MQKNLLWFDSIAGLSVGCFVLTLSPWLSRLYELPLGLVIGVGVANLVYGSYSFSLARRSQRPLSLIGLLAGANITWGVACLVAAGLVAQTASLLGLATLIFEGLFVGALGVVEWRLRRSLTGAY